jgi:hypothetical protein
VLRYQPFLLPLHKKLSVWYTGHIYNLSLPGCHVK